MLLVQSGTSLLLQGVSIECRCSIEAAKSLSAEDVGDMCLDAMILLYEIPSRSKSLC